MEWQHFPSLLLRSGLKGETFWFSQLPPRSSFGKSPISLSGTWVWCAQHRPPVKDRVAFPHYRKLVSQLRGLFPHENKGGVAQPQGPSSTDLVPKKDSLFPNPASYSCQITSPLTCPGCKMLAGLSILAASFCPQAGVFFSIQPAWLSFQGTGPLGTQLHTPGQLSLPVLITLLLLDIACGMPELIPQPQLCW